jgi:hypothetical protein
MNSFIPIEITSHLVKGEPNALTVKAMDGRTPGGARHEYVIGGFRRHDAQDSESSAVTQLLVPFQSGPIKENGVNGVTQEALLAILIDRLECFQAGPFASRDNEMALVALRDALYWLQTRTLARIARNVEGTSAQ